MWGLFRAKGGCSQQRCPQPLVSPKGDRKTHGARQCQNMQQPATGILPARPTAHDRKTASKHVNDVSATRWRHKEH